MRDLKKINEIMLNDDDDDAGTGHLNGWCTRGMAREEKEAVQEKQQQQHIGI